VLAVEPFEVWAKWIGALAALYQRRTKSGRTPTSLRLRRGST
jgi:hypothetical protein